MRLTTKKPPGILRTANFGQTREIEAAIHSLKNFGTDQHVR